MSVLDRCIFLFLNSFVIVIFYVSTFPLSFFLSISFYLFLIFSLSLLLFCPLFLSHQYFVLTLPVRSLLSGAIISCLWKTCRLSLTPTHTHTHWHRHRQHSSLPRHQGRIQSKKKYMHFFLKTCFIYNCRFFFLFLNFNFLIFHSIFSFSFILFNFF